MSKMMMIILVSLFLNIEVFAKSPLTPIQILKKMDELYRSEYSISNVQMKIKTPDWSRELEMKIWTKGMDYTLVRILSPKKDKGVSTLKRKKQMWNFLPKINKVIKVPPAMMMGSWMGSDFTNDDLVKESSYKNDYEVQFEQSDPKIFLLYLTPKKETLSLWGKIKMKVDAKNYLPLQQDFYDEKNILIRTLYFKEIKKIGTKTLPTLIELVPQTKEKKGNKTVIRYLNMEFDKPISENIFTRNYLQRRR